VACDWEGLAWEELFWQGLGWVVVVLCLWRHCEEVFARAVDIAVGCGYTDGRVDARGLRAGRQGHHVWVDSDGVAS
jgi:hypothetical protein